MGEEAAPATEATPDAPVVDADDAIDRAIATVKAKPAPEPEKAKPAAEPKPKRHQDIAALAKREWTATQAQKAADELSAKYTPLEDALGRKDLVSALNVLAERHGVTFEDFVAALTAEQAPEKTAAQLATEAVDARLKDRDDATKAEAAKELETRIGNMRTHLQGMADKGGERWELTAVADKGGEAWDLIDQWFAATGESLSADVALDKIEEKLRAKRDARRPKQEAVTEAGPGKKNGKAVTPSFSNRNTSGVPAAVGADEADHSSLSDHEAIDRVARKIGISL